MRAKAESRKLIYDAQYLSLGGLQDKAASSMDLDHWPYERAKVLLSRDDELGRLVASPGAMPADFRSKRLVHSSIDAWIPPYRANKCLKRGQTASARLLVTRGARALSRLVFALEWRWVPLDHWLEPELRTLEDKAHVGPLIIEALNTAIRSRCRKVWPPWKPALQAAECRASRAPRSLYGTGSPVAIQWSVQYMDSNTSG